MTTKVKKPFKIRIRWGESISDSRTATYRFETKAELDAFLYGISEGEGWQAWEEL